MRSVVVKECVQQLKGYGYAITGVGAGAAACLNRGFFFTEEMYAFLTVWFMACLVIFGYRGISAGRKYGQAQALPVEGSRLPQLPPNGQTSSSALQPAAAVLLAGPVILALLYIFRLVDSPLSLLGTINEWLRWGFYGSYAYVMLAAAQHPGGRRLLRAGWHALGMILCLSGLLAICGGIKLPYAVAYSSSAAVSATGARLGGLLEYPNAFGAAMAVFLLERLFAAAAHPAIDNRVTGEKWRAGSESRAGKASGESKAGRIGARNAAGKASGESKTGRIAVWSAAGKASGESKTGRITRLRLLPLFPYAAALLLSESRGAWLSAACACAAALLWKRRLWLALLIAGAAPMAAAALFYRQLAAAGLAMKPLPGLLLLAGCWAGAHIAGLHLHRRVQGAAGGVRAALLLLAALGWTAGGTAVFLQVHARIMGPSGTAAARGRLYRDALRLAEQAPWLGRGGETWRSSYLAAQSSPYVGSQVHNGFLDLLLNLGILGLVAALLMLVAVGWLAAGAGPGYLAAYLVIVLHAAVDFDWSYGLFWMLLFGLAALVAADNDRLREGKGDRPPADVPSAVMPVELVRRQAGGKLHRQPRHQAIVLAIACTGCFSLGLIAFHAEKGEVLYRQALKSADAESRAALLQQSLDWNPLAYHSAVLLSEMLPQEQGRERLQSSLRYAPDSPVLNWELAKRSLQGDQPGNALYQVRRALQLDVYNNGKRTAAMQGMLQLGRRRLQDGDRLGAMHSAAAGLELLRQYRLLAERVEQEEAGANDRQFRVTDTADDLDRRLRMLLAEAVN